MKKKQIVSLLLVLVLLGSFLAGCTTPNGESIPNQGASSDDAEVVELTFWDENPGTIQTPLYEELIEEFNSLHDDIHVTYGDKWFFLHHLLLFFALSNRICYPGFASNVM